MSKQIKCRSRATAGFKAPNGDAFVLEAGAYLLIKESELTAERTMNGGGYRVERGAAYHPDSGATSTQVIWVDAIDPEYHLPTTF